MASRLGTALTPLPQWCTTVAGSRPASRASNSALQLVRRLERPSAPRFEAERAVQGAGDVAGHRVQRLDFAAKARCGARVDQGLGRVGPVGWLLLSVVASAAFGG